MFEWLRNIFRKDRKRKYRFTRWNGEYHEEWIDPENYERIKVLHLQFNPRKPLDQMTFVWCLVGNIIGEHPFGTEKEIKIGTKHFLANTKVYCFPVLWGDGYEKIKVIGRHRKNKRFITIVIASKYVTNWRLQKVYKPHILKEMYDKRGGTDKEEDKKDIVEMVKWLNENQEQWG